MNINPNLIDPSTLNIIADTLKILFPAVAAGLVMASRIALRAMAAVVGSVASIGALIIQGIWTHYSRKRED